MAPRTSRQGRSSHRSTLSLTKTEVKIHVYDLLPPSRLSSTLWALGASILHSGVVINGKEYAYDGHECEGVSGVYWTSPRNIPSGATFRCEIVHGYTFATPAEIDATIKDVSSEFLGTSYHLLTRNCNHFTQRLVERLTGRAGPSWLNRAASIGAAVPCMVPKGWIEPPIAENAEGVVMEDPGGPERRCDTEESSLDEDADEASYMLRSGPQRA